MVALIVPITMSLLTWGYNSLSFKSHATTNTPFDFEVGDTFNDLSNESKELMHQAKVETVDNSKHFYYSGDRLAPNTDSCFIFNEDCKPDYEHRVYKIPMTDHQGYFYKVTFSYNWRILEIKNDYTHS